MGEASKKNTKDFNRIFADKTEFDNLIEWAKETRYSDNQLCNRVTEYTTAKANMRNTKATNKRKRRTK